MMTIQQAFETAFQHHQAGRLQEAEALYRQILAVAPSHADAWHLLGTVALRTGRTDLAVEWIQRAIALAPDFAGAYHSLGGALKSRGQLEDAIRAYRRAVELAPEFPEAHDDLGITLQQGGQWEEAAHAHRRAVELDPNFPEAFNNLGLALAVQHRHEEAIAAYERALQLDPQLAAVHYNIGNVYRERLLFEPAVAAYQHALALDPSYAQAWNNLGAVLEEQRRLDEAEVALRRAVALQPDYAAAYGNLANVLRGQSRFDEAIAAAERSIALQPAVVNPHNTLAGLLRESGELDAALDAYGRALALDGNRADIHSNLIFARHFHPAQDAVALIAEQRRWNQRFGPPTRSAFAPWRPSPEPERRLRIGYVSPDLREHVVGRNLQPLLAQHDHAQFEIFCYSDVRRPDARTAALRGHADHWRETAAKGDDTLAEIIRRDRVDVLVDLAQHLAGNRLSMFARGPAAVQVSFAGYPASAGVDAITHRISDRWMEGNVADVSAAERVHLLESFWCYDPGEEQVPVNDLPATTNGCVTFGCLNNFCKVNEPLLHLWARVLREIPGSRLLILSAHGIQRGRVTELFVRDGVELGRVEFAAPSPRKEYLEHYHRIDVVLDTFPYNGHTTSLDALWMGVPVVSLAGETTVARAGLSQLSNLGMPELVAHSADEYVAVAVRLARDLPRLSQMRSTLRTRMKNSVLMDAPRFARQIEQVYREIWRQWCAENRGV